jgi:dGTPase
MINSLVLDLIGETVRRIQAAGPASLEDVRRAGPLVAFSAPMRAEQNRLKTFLREELYQHYRVRRMTSKARRIVSELFDAFRGDLRLLPRQFQERVARDGPRAIADYVAGMTDRYAIAEHRRLFAVGEI